MEKREITLEIDGREVRAREGMTLLEAARTVGIPIPTLCYHPALTPFGACRLCSVEIFQKGRSRIVTSCVYPVEEGLVVKTKSERVMRDRKMIIELLLARAPKAEVIQHLAQEYGVDGKRFKTKKEDELCVLCGLCTRICKERIGVSAINFIGRGTNKKVGPPFEIQSDVCIGCGACVSVCPTGAIKLEHIAKHKPTPIASEFNMRLNSRHPIYIPFPQAVPKLPVIDQERCVHFITGKCKVCESFCEAGAINHDQEDEIMDVEVGAVILATGLDLYDVSPLKEYGYGVIKNVITALEYERLTSASGPTAGELRRPSDGKTPSNIAFIQCVGSRDFKNNAYCSSVCCMHATKEAIMAYEHHPGTKSTIFYMDLRAVGKRFQEYVARARDEYNVTYIRGRPGKIEVNPENQNPIIWYEDTTTGETKSLEAELVVLAQALIPSEGIKELAKTLGISLEEHGFVEIPDRLFRPVDTTRPGIFACGYCQSPRDIPDSVVQGAAAAARAAEVLTEKAKVPILVVDDEAIMRKSLEDWLVEQGFQVATAKDGEEAVEIIGRQEFIVVILDLKLPGKNGIEVLKEARTQKPDLKAVIITAYPSAETTAEAMAAGAIDYLIKPFALDTLERVIEEAGVKVMP